MPKPVTARYAAATALMRVHKGGWASAAAAALDAPGLDSQNRAFAGALFYGTVERLATLDFLLALFLKKPPAKLDPEVRAALETGLYQLLYMRVPASAGGCGGGPGGPHPRGAAGSCL